MSLTWSIPPRDKINIYEKNKYNAKYNIYKQFPRKVLKDHGKERLHWEVAFLSAIFEDGKREHTQNTSMQRVWFL